MIQAWVNDHDTSNLHGITDRRAGRVRTRLRAPRLRADALRDHGYPRGGGRSCRAARYDSARRMGAVLPCGLLGPVDPSVRVGLAVPLLQLSVVLPAATMLTPGITANPSFSEWTSMFGRRQGHRRVARSAGALL